ncbi:transmembrane protein 170B isoform X4 [Lagopus muta]|nr:transmembrane protein 170B isoform X4 [Lagopus muta]
MLWLGRRMSSWHRRGGEHQTACCSQMVQAEMWYWVFLWALFSSLFVHGAVGVLMFVMLQRHRQGRLISVIVVSIGFLGSVTGAMITSAAVAGIYRVAGKNMAPLEALVFGVGQTVLTLIISFSRILATL